MKNHKNFGRKPAAVFAADKSQYQWGFYPFQSVGHQTNTMGYGSTGNYVDGQANHRNLKFVKHCSYEKAVQYE